MRKLGYNALLNLAHTLKNSQGFYSRLYSQLIKMTPDEIDDLNEIMFKQDFKTDIDIILWLES